MEQVTVLGRQQLSGEHDKGIDPHHDEMLTGPAHVVVLGALQRDQTRTWHRCHKTEEGMTRDILHVHPADPHHTLQACAFGPVISEGYSLGNTQDSLLLDLKEKGQGDDAAAGASPPPAANNKGVCLPQNCPRSTNCTKTATWIVKPCPFHYTNWSLFKLEKREIQRYNPHTDRGSWI